MSDFTNINGVYAKDTTLRQDIDNLSARAENLEFMRLNLEDFFNLRRRGKVYRIKIWKYEINQTTVCVKQLDNAGLVATPSTDTVEGRDDYLDIPLFKWYRCNYIRIANGSPIITSIEGDNNFKTSGNVDVGSFGMSFYHKWSEDEEAYYWTISDSPNAEYDLQPWGEFIDENGDRLPYWCYSAYHGLYSQPDLPPYIYQSHNTMITNYQTKGTGYWGQGYDKYAFCYLMMLMKYGDLGAKSSQNVFTGCTSYNYQYTAAIKDSTAHSYFPLTVAQGNNIVVGSCVEIGYANLNTSTGALNIDRSAENMRAYANCVKVISKETVNVDGTDYVFVYLDCEPFTTEDVDISNVTWTDVVSAVYLSTMPWSSGSTDAVIGKKDGSFGSNTNSKYPYRIMGIECATGAWEVIGDTVMYTSDDYTKDFYQAPKGIAHTNNTTTIQNTYNKAGTMLPEVRTRANFWIGDINVVGNGVFFASKQGSGANVGCGDYCYYSYTTGWREVLLCGSLLHGSYAGCCCLACSSGLSNAYWSYVAAD